MFTPVFAETTRAKSLRKVWLNLSIGEKWVLLDFVAEGRENWPRPVMIFIDWTSAASLTEGKASVAREMTTFERSEKGGVDEVRGRGATKNLLFARKVKLFKFHFRSGVVNFLSRPKIFSEVLWTFFESSTQNFLAHRPTFCTLPGGRPKADEPKFVQKVGRWARKNITPVFEIRKTVIWISP